MAKVKSSEQQATDSLVPLAKQNYILRGLDAREIDDILADLPLASEKLYSNRPVFTSFRPGLSLEFLYLIVSGGPVVVRSSPLDRIIALHYPGGCFGMGNLPISFAPISRAFPSLVEAYKTTDVIKVPVETIQRLYTESPMFRDRYNLFFELREKFQYHLLNCSTYPPQAVATILRALIYQERALGNQPNDQGIYHFDLPVDIIARVSQLNHRTVEQVLKGLKQERLIAAPPADDSSGDLIQILSPEGLKEVYSSTRDKVSWWPLR
ncbi:Crp/Fnr family transcriptional regulator [Synechococcales cyanobacterium C]|uniref:Crp/Fnr family transcriptional regulator n=1 Tax=Petrachloros mirabilis ULC683 TaxID=2781853 RepID=A0A8K1ZWR9_9CYAN|nr:Crp/Fnr family transcriptional regulator [Petrachloros mirabilis]NCJ05312.1 Crp/Fnr family transcriptional regulator [Petrachloros mirabilis ULC683]